MSKGSFTKLICGINLILPPLLQASDYQLIAAGRYSIASPIATSTFNEPQAENKFTDYGGAFYFTRESFSWGFSTGLYSSTAARTLSTRYAMGWVPVLLHARKYFFQNLLFTDIGAGPAYGFGATEMGGIYSRITEWGGIVSGSLGVEYWNFQLAIEVAYLVSNIYNQSFMRPGLMISLHF